MFKSFVLIVAFASVVTATVPQIHQIFGVVSPIENCGGIGFPHELRISGCSGSPPCDIVADRDVTVEGDFTTGGSCVNAKFNIDVELPAGGEIPVSEGDLGTLNAGATYTVQQTIRASDLLAGQTVNMRATVSCPATDALEICIRAPMRILAAP